MTSWPGQGVRRSYRHRRRRGHASAAGAGGAGQLTLDDGHDGALLDGRWALEPIGVHTTEELGLERHVVERVGGLIVVGLDLACARLNVSWEPRVGRGSTVSAGMAMAIARRGSTYPRARPQDLCQP